MWWTPAYDYHMISSSISFLHPSMFCCLQGTDICPLLYCSYTLYGLTFYVRHRQHYTCKIKHFAKWVYYDGLTEKQCPGSGLSVQHILAQLGTPSHCFYAQLWGTQCRSGLKKGWAKIIRAIFQLDHDQLTSILLSHLFWIFQSTLKLQLMILAAITMLWAFLNCFLLVLDIFLIKKLNVFTSCLWYITLLWRNIKWV